MALENLSLEARDELASLMHTLAESPDTREDILRLTKKVKPGLNIPEIDLKEIPITHYNKCVRKTRLFVTS